MFSSCVFIVMDEHYGVIYSSSVRYMHFSCAVNLTKSRSLNFSTLAGVLLLHLQLDCSILEV